MDIREKLIAMLPPERQAKVRYELELLRSLKLYEMSNAALSELYDACAEEISRRDQLAE